MPIFGPIVSDRKYRRFGVLDLEWVPGETLLLPVNTTVQIEGLSEEQRLPLPAVRCMTSPLKIRLAGYYDRQPATLGDNDSEPEMIEKYQCFETVRDLIDTILVRETRGMWFFAHAGGLASSDLSK